MADQTPDPIDVIASEPDARHPMLDGAPVMIGDILVADHPDDPYHHIEFHVGSLMYDDGRDLDSEVDRGWTVSPINIEFEDDAPYEWPLSECTRVSDPCFQVVPIVDDATRQEVEALVADQTPHVCVFCKGTGWIDDDGWSYYGDGWTPGSKPRERRESDGLVPCGMCGDWHVYRDERTEPTMVVDGWSSEQESRAAELLAAAYLRRND